jgi:hypothetical protein
MSNEPERVYQSTLALLKPALERVVKDPEFRKRLEAAPLAALAEVGIKADAALEAELAGKRFSEFWAARRAAVEGPIGTRDLPPPSDAGSLHDEQLESVVGGAAFPGKGPPPNFAPPYVPVGPVIGGENVTVTAAVQGASVPVNVTVDPLKSR